MSGTGFSKVIGTRPVRHDVAARAPLEKTPRPTDGQARHWLAGNLCRRTGYDKIVRAVLGAAGGNA